MMLLTVTDISLSTTFVFLHPAWSWEKARVSRSSKDDWVLAEFITLCDALEQ
jgi:hypothetical protein